MGSSNHRARRGASRAAAVLSLGGALAFGCGGKPAPSAPAIAPSQAKVALSLRTETLPNGLRLIVNEDHRIPFVAVAVCYHVGSKDDPDERGGLAHFYEHLMFVGTQRAKPFLDEMSALDAVSNAGTMHDQTRYWEIVPRKALARALWLEADRMAYGPTLDAFVREREVVKNERRQRVEETPYGNVPQLAAEALFPVGHPYRHEIAGTLDELDAISAADVSLFRRRYYVPDNATLVIVGDVDATQAITLSERYFAPIPARGSAPAALRAPIAAELGEEQIVRVEAGVKRPRVYVSWAVPPAYAGDWLEVRLASGFIGGTVERLFVEERKIARDVQATYYPGLLASTIELRVDLLPGTSTEAAKDYVYDAISRLTRRRGGRFPLDASVRAAERYTSRLFYDLEPLGGRAEQLAYYDDFAGNPLAPFQFVREASNVHPDHIQDAFLERVFYKKAVYVLVEPKPGAPLAGRVVRRKP